MSRRKKVADPLKFLQVLHIFPYLTVKQMMRVFNYAPDSNTFVGDTMKWLWEPIPEDATKKKDRAYYEYVERGALFTQLQVREYCYWLSTKGRNALRKLNYPFDGWPEPAKMAPFLRSPQFPHFQETTDFLIEFNLITTMNPNLRVRQLPHYHNIKRFRKIIKEADGRTRHALVEPDGWADVHYVSSDKERYYCVEVDRATEDDKFIEKISNILYFVEQGDYQRLYHPEEKHAVIPTWLFFTSMGKTRGEKMMTMIEDVLVSKYHTDKANWFRVYWTDGIPFSVDMLFQEVWTIPKQQGRRQVVSIFGS